MSETTTETPDYAGQTIDLSILNDAALDELRRDVVIEQEKRYVLAHAEQQAQELNERYTQAIGRKDGDEWIAPTGAHDAYPPKSVVSVGGQFFRNDHSGVNPWKPGDVNASWTPIWEVDGEWSDVPPVGDDGKPAAWMSGVAYKVGNKVTHDGATWECVLAHTSHDGWKPSAETHAVWKRIN